jgi:hypothetical protein
MRQAGLREHEIPVFVTELAFPIAHDYFVLRWSRVSSRTLNAFSYRFAFALEREMLHHSCLLKLNSEFLTLKSRNTKAQTQVTDVCSKRDQAQAPTCMVTIDFE